VLVLRTAKGQVELRSRERGLLLRERSVLFLADGTKTLAMLQKALGSDGRELIERLAGAGYLQLVSLAEAAKAPEPDATPAATPAPYRVDALSGRRSLAGTRMYLFDLCERTFARGAPAKAERFRERLRQARDGRSMLAVAEDMLMDLEELAGWERAQAVRERIEALVPAPDDIAEG
jgi:hypothetical protein